MREALLHPRPPRLELSITITGWLPSELLFPGPGHPAVAGPLGWVVVIPLRISYWPPGQEVFLMQRVGLRSGVFSKCLNK